MHMNGIAPTKMDGLDNFPISIGYFSESFWPVFFHGESDLGATFCRATFLKFPYQAEKYHGRHQYMLCSQHVQVFC